MLALDACLYLFAKALLLAFVLEPGLVVQPSKICNFRSSSGNTAVFVCHCLVTRQGTTARRALSAAIHMSMCEISLAYCQYIVVGCVLSILGSPPSLHLVPLNQDGALVLRLRSRRIPSKFG